MTDWHFFGVFQGSAAAPTLATSFKSLKLSPRISDDVPRRQLSVVSNEAAVSKVGGSTSEGLQKSASSAAKLTKTVSSPSSSESHLTRNVTVLNGGPSGLWSGTSVDSEMLRVSEPSSTSSRDLAGLVRDAVSAVDVGHGESVVFPSVVETPSDQELGKTSPYTMDDTDKITHIVEASEIPNTDNQSQPSYPRCDEDVTECPDNPAKVASYVQTVTEHGIRDETVSQHRENSVEQMFEAPNDSDSVATQNAGYVENAAVDVQNDFIAKHVIGDLGMEASRPSMKLSSEVPTVDLGVTEDLADDVDRGRTLVQMPGSNADVRSDSLEDQLATSASIGMIDILPLSELPSAVDEAVPIETEVAVVQKEENVDTTAAGLDREWPPLPSDEQLMITNAELEQSVESSDLHPTSPQHGVSVGTESGTLTKLGASEKVLTHAAHLRDVDSMHRFK